MNRFVAVALVAAILTMVLTDAWAGDKVKIKQEYYTPYWKVKVKHHVYPGYYPYPYPPAYAPYYPPYYAPYPPYYYYPSYPPYPAPAPPYYGTYRVDIDD